MDLQLGLGSRTVWLCAFSYFAKLHLHQCLVLLMQSRYHALSVTTVMQLLLKILAGNFRPLGLVEEFESTLHRLNNGDELLARQPFDVSQCPLPAKDLRRILRLNDHILDPAQSQLLGAWVSSFQRAIEERVHRFQGEPSFHDSRKMEILCCAWFYSATC